MRANVRQDYFSCGQFNNVLASLLHALALSRMLCRTLVLPGFFVRFGARMTRVSNFSERWLPTGHFFNLSVLRRGFHVKELQALAPPPHAAPHAARRVTRSRARGRSGCRRRAARRAAASCRGCSGARRARARRSCASSRTST